MGYCAVGSHANLSAVGQGDYGGQSPRKIEMFLDGMVECSDKQKHKDKNNGININYDTWQRRRPRLEETWVVTHRKRENERRKLLQGIP